MFEIGYRYGNNVDRRRAIVGSRRTGLRMVSDGFGQLYARRIYIHRSRLPTAGMERGQTYVVPQRLTVQKRQSIVFVKRIPIDHQ